MVADYRRGRPFSALRNALRAFLSVHWAHVIRHVRRIVVIVISSVRLVRQDSAKLFLLLFLNGTKPLLIVIYVLHSQVCPSREREVAENLEIECKELEDPPYQDSTTPSEGLGHRLTNQEDLHEKAENSHVDYAKPEARP
jgi:hypothetical protein